MNKVTSAQNYLTSTGTPAFSAPEPAEYGFVDASDGNLHLEIPLGSYPQRGSQKPEPIILTYDGSVVWTVAGAVNLYWSSLTIGTDPTSGGWTSDSGQPLYGYLTAVGDGPLNGQDIQCAWDYTYVDASGTQHAFPPNGAEPPGQPGCGGAGTEVDSLATDSSGYHLYVNCISSPCVTNVYAPDGTMVYQGVPTKDANGNFIRVEDSNGNYISDNYITGTTTHHEYIDTVGRQIGVFNQSGSIGNPNSQNTLESYTFTWTTVPAYTDFGQAGVAECQSSCTVSVLQSISLPDGSSFSFKYDCDSTTGNTACGSPGGQSVYYAMLISMTMPTGGTVTYTWNLVSDPYGNKHMWLASRTSASGRWTYANKNLSTCSETQVGCQQQVTSTKPSGDTTVYTFTLDNGDWPVEVQRYNALGTLLDTVKTTWDLTHACPWYDCYGHAYVSKLSETETVPVPGGTSITKQTTYSHASYQSGLVSAIQEWKFYPGTAPTFPGVPDRATYINYLTTGTNNIDRPTSVTICNNSGSDSACDGSGTRVSQTLTTYDQYGTNGLTLISNISNHDDTNFGLANTARGNPTSVSQWVSSTTYLTSTMTYDTTGQVLSVTGPTAKNPTYYGYSDNYFTDGSPAQTFTPSAATNAYKTSITLPGIANPITYGYYYGTGQQATEIDPNLQSTYSHYLDPFSRPTEDVYPIGWDLTTYPSTTEVDTYQAVADTSASTSCSSCLHNQSLYDGFGRQISQILANAPAGPIEVDTVYDSNSRVQQQSHPYSGKSDANYLFETFGYDGVDRTASQSHPDGQSSRAAYAASVTNLGGVTSQQLSAATYGYGYPVISLDEAGKQRQEWIDGFGHVIEVDEPSASTNTPATATLIVSGSEGTHLKDPDCSSGPPGTELEPICIYLPDTGSLTVDLNGFDAETSWGLNSTAASVAAALVTSLNSPLSPVTATLNGTTITMTSVAPAATVPFTVTENGPYDDFSAAPTSGSLTGGTGGISQSPFATAYTYDPLGNLTGVIQGSQTRSYQYDGLSRRTSATTPEAGTVALYYTTSGGALCADESRNVCRRSDARGTTTTYSYDALNRVTAKTYSDGTGSVSYLYDHGGASAYALTRLTEMTDSSGSESYIYDKIGRVTQLTKVIGSQTFSTSVVMDPGGEVTQINYPSGRTVQQSFDIVGRLCEVAASTTGCNTSSAPFTTAYTYAPPGVVESFEYGNGIAATFTYSAPRSLLSSLTYASGSTTLFGLNYWFQNNSTNCPTGTTGNNTQIQCITDTVAAGRSVSYTYDSIGRVSSGVTSGSTAYPQWGLSWTYDRYGNRTAQTVTAGSAPSNSLSVSATTNRPSGYTFDASGDMTVEAAGSTYDYAYDAEQRMTSVSGGASAAYSYDGNSLRIKKAVSGGTTTVYVYALGNDIAEYDNGAAVTAPSREYIYSGPTLVSTLSAGTTNYELWDQLSVRMTTNSSGSVVGQQGHFPFGEPWYSANTTSEFLFTSYQHDSETGLDYAMARYYDSRMGRFCSPDPAEGWPGDPQSWNRYAYSRNDPVNLTDPSGQSWLAKLLEAIALVVIDTYFPPALAFEADGGIADTMLLNTALAADMRMTQIKNYGFPEETQNPQTAQKPVYCDPGIMAAMLAAYNMGQTMTNAKGSRWEGGFPAYQGSGGTYSAGNGPANKSAEIQTGPATGFSINYRQGAVAIFHTHPGSSSTSGWPSTPSNNAGEGASGDTGAAIAKQTDIYVISNSGLAKAPANGPKDPTYDNKNNSPYIVQGKDIGDWMKTLKTKCNGPQ